MQVEIDDGHVNILGRNEARDHDRVHSFYKNAYNLAEPEDVLILAHTFS